MIRFSAFGLIVLLVLLFAGCSENNFNPNSLQEEPAVQNQSILTNPNPAPVLDYQASMGSNIGKGSAHGAAAFNYDGNFTQLEFMFEVYNLNQVKKIYIYYKEADELMPVAQLYSSVDDPDSKIDSHSFSKARTLTEEDLIGCLQGEPLEALFECMNSEATTYIVALTTRHPEFPGEIAGEIVSDQ